MTSRIVTIAQSKGGAGKTTLAVQLATAMLAAGEEVCVIDVDPQGSLSRWFEERQRRRDPADRLALVKTGGWRLGVELGRVVRDFSTVVVDTPPHAGTELKATIREASLVLVPCQPSPLDVWASRPTLEIAAKEGRPIRFLMNRVPPRGRSIEEAQGALAQLGAVPLEAVLGNRQSYVAAMARGLGVLEHEPRGTAAQEVAQLCREVTSITRSGGARTA
ncbi:ParA family partition ATPase [Geminicoccus roseus]|uniref:ParA family partition ATPase n=1 Tax=Geminicoccus roseus TaxID=404900 RepID=UPI000424D236|nr:ParA family partition ATPase [Geminicoccus roseus]